MNKNIAVCIDAEAFQVNRIFDPDWAAKFPGAEVMSELAKLTRRKNIDIATGDIALSHIKTGYWHPNNIQLITEADDPHGLKLVELGCEPKIIYCFESPIFAWKFYDNIQQTAWKYENRIFFRGILDTFSAKSGQNHNAYFPSFNADNGPINHPWQDRKYMVLVAGNKFWKKSARFSFSLKLSKYRQRRKKYSIEKNSPTLSIALDSELQSKRLAMIEHFGSAGKLNIFGRDWHRLDKMPPRWQKRLKTLLAELNPQPCSDKVKTISDYKFAIAFENVSYPGYVTEKIIDCFAASVIPIYLGAPDIADFIPPQAFIDMRKFDSFRQLEEYLDGIDIQTASKIIAAGADFLNSQAGQKYSYQHYAKMLFELVSKQ